MYATIAEIRRANAAAGRCFFAPETLRFFRSRILTSIYPVSDGAYFITSEQYPGWRDSGPGPRRYTVRFARQDGYIDTVGEFMAYAQPRDARRAAKEYARLRVESDLLKVRHIQRRRRARQGARAPRADL